MRIISPVRDYYDGVQRMGADRTLVYVRNPEETADRNVPRFTDGLDFERLRGEWPAVRIETVTIGFCGRFHLRFGVVGDGEPRYHREVQEAVDDVVALADTRGERRRWKEWLANQQDPPQDIDDETLASMKGFDERSFRADSPGQEAQRRAKKAGEPGA